MAFNGFAPQDLRPESIPRLIKILEMDGPHFDRSPVGGSFLLKNSKIYRASMSKAKKMNFKFIPNVVGAVEALTDFDPGKRAINFSPLSEYFLKILRKRTRLDILRAQFGLLQSMNHSLLHDVHHAFIHSRLKSSVHLKDKNSVLNFFGLCEALVQVRDVELAEELGDMGMDLLMLRSIYRAVPTAYVASCGHQGMFFEKFSGLLMFKYAHIRRASWKKIGRLLSPVEAQLAMHPTNPTYSRGSYITVGDWYQNKGKGFLGQQGRSNKKLYTMGPEQLAKDLEMRKKLYELYCEIF